MPVKDVNVPTAALDLIWFRDGVNSKSASVYGLSGSKFISTAPSNEESWPTNDIKAFKFKWEQLINGDSPM